MEMKKLAFLAIVAPFIFVLSTMSCRPSSVSPGNNAAPAKTDQEKAIGRAQQIFAELKLSGTDMSDGPCLSNEVIPDWVADVAHEPRQAVDNKPENQCPAYREGKARHFVELDPEGNFIRAY